MEYNQEEAERIQRTYGVADATLRVWKNRNKIPDRYAEKLIPIKHKLKSLEPEWYSAFLQSLSENQRKEFQRYAQENLIEKKAKEKLVKQRLRDFRAWVRSI